MGRRKIEIQPITHERNRSVTFLKRKNGLFKKAYELGVLCSVDVAVIIFESKPSSGHHVKLHQYCSTDVHDIVQRHIRHDGEKDIKTVADFSGSAAARADDGDEDEGEEDDGAMQQDSVPVVGRPGGSSKRQRVEERTSFSGKNSSGGGLSPTDDLGMALDMDYRPRPLLSTLSSSHLHANSAHSSLPISGERHRQPSSTHTLPHSHPHSQSRVHHQHSNNTRPHLSPVSVPLSASNSTRISPLDAASPNGGGGGSGGAGYAGYSGAGGGGGGLPGGSSYRQTQYSPTNSAGGNGGTTGGGGSSSHFFPVSAHHQAHATYLPSFDFGDPHLPAQQQQHHHHQHHPHSHSQSHHPSTSSSRRYMQQQQSGNGRYASTGGGGGGTSNQDLLASLLGTAGSSTPTPTGISVGGLSWPMHVDQDPHVQTHPHHPRGLVQSQAHSHSAHGHGGHGHSQSSQSPHGGPLSSTPVSASGSSTSAASNPASASASATTQQHETNWLEFLSGAAASSAPSSSVPPPPPPGSAGVGVGGMRGMDLFPLSPVDNDVDVDVDLAAGGGGGRGSVSLDRDDLDADGGGGGGAARSSLGGRAKRDRERRERERGAGADGDGYGERESLRDRTRGGGGVVVARSERSERDGSVETGSVG